MQTNFTAAQLQDPTIAQAESILRRCVHCGLCTATCPTYVLLGDERDSPRGRIYAIKDMLEKGINSRPEVSTHIDRCLSCFSCMTTCPSGVDYAHLVEIARNHIEKTGTRSLKARTVRRMLAAIMPYPNRFRWALKAAPLGRQLGARVPPRRTSGVGGHDGTGAQAADARPKFKGPGTAATKGARTARVIMLAGCAQQVLRSEINDATIRLLARGGVDVIVSAGAGCCGALTQHIGLEDQALAVRQTQCRCVVEGDRQGASRRHHHQRVRLRHDCQRLWPSAVRRSRLRRARTSRCRRSPKTSPNF